MWYCSFVSTEQEPRDEAEEGLALQWVKRPHEHLKMQSQPKREVVEALRGCRRDVVEVATDGSSEQQSAGAWAIAINGETAAVKVGGMLTGADQGNYCAELEAVWQLIQANREAREELRILTDNKAVVDGVRKLLGGEKWNPAYAFRRWEEMRAPLRGQQVRIEWIPSHGKRADWKPDSTPLTAQQCRSLNEAADEEAGRHCQRQKERYDFQGVAAEIDRASRRAEKALRRLHMGTLKFINDRPELVEEEAWQLQDRIFG